VKKKLSRAVQQFTPYKWDKAEWHCMSSVRSLLLTSVMVVLFLTCEANAFFLKFVLWIPPNNNLNLVRLAFWLPFGAHVLREFHEFVTDVSVNKIGSHVWLAISILMLECLLCYRREDHSLTPCVCEVSCMCVCVMHVRCRVGQDMKEFEQPFPQWVKAMVASVVCLWLALVCWVWKNPGWVWGGGKLYLRCVMLVMAYLLLLLSQTNFDFCSFADAGIQKKRRQRQEKGVTACSSC